MDHSLLSNGESSFSDIIVTDYETEILSQMKSENERLDQELDEALVSAFNDISENDDQSEDGSESEDDDHEKNLHTDSFVATERQISSETSMANSNLHQRSNGEFENKLTKEDSCYGTEENHFSADQNKLASNLQDSRKSDSQLDKNKLLEVVKNVTMEPSFNGINNEMQSELVNYESTISLLKNQLNELNTTDHLSCDHHDKIIKEMKLTYESNIDELQSKLNSKMKEAEDLALKNLELQRKYQQLQLEKEKWVNQISEEFMAQKKCQLFLESGTIEEISRLKHQVQLLEEEKSCIEKENLLLKESFFQRWMRSLFFWQLQCVRRVSNIVGLNFI